MAGICKFMKEEIISGRTSIVDTLMDECRICRNGYMCLHENAWAYFTNAAREIVADAEDKMQNNLHRG
jgi:hypothetical protein